jgi:hypothetical protein
MLFVQRYLSDERDSMDSSHLADVSDLGDYPFAFEDYLELVDTVGRAVHPAKRGFILNQTPATFSLVELPVLETV